MGTTWSERLGKGWRAVRPFAPLILATAAMAIISTQAILARTGGSPAVPLDDTFIHFQFARSWAELHPLVYSPGTAATPGATSLLWPLVLAPFYAVGFRDTSLIWVAWLIGWVSLGLLAWETRRLAERITSSITALAAGAMVLAFGGYIWFAASGMEVLPFSWLITRTTRRAAEWGELPGDAPDEPRSLARRRFELCLLGSLAPLLRPEGILVSGMAAVALGAFPRGSRRTWLLVPLVGPLLGAGLNWLLTGQPGTTTMAVKWLPSSPYRHEIWGKLAYHLDVLFNTLLDGRVWSSVFLPRGSKLVAWIAPPALLAVGWLRGARWRTLLVLALAGGIVIPTTYDSFLVNRLRYLWPFAAAWFVALAAMAEGVGAVSARLRPELVHLRLLVAGGFVGALAGHLSFAIDDLAVSADAIRLQQVSLARWAARALPPHATVGVNDAGAIAYLSGHRTFDVVGLTTLGEARYWVAGAGSRFEHYERLGREQLPTHFIVYESWFGIPALLGERLTQRTVRNATILGAATKTACVADYSKLGSANLPALGEPWSQSPVDSLDVADLESEQAHDFSLFWATQQQDVVLRSWDGRVDGARRARTLDQFSLKLVPGGRLVARWATERSTVLTVEAGGQNVATKELTGLPVWEEVVIDLPENLLEGRQQVLVRAAEGTTFTSLYYWAYR
jgi:hypothetical protein